MPRRYVPDTVPTLIDPHNRRRFFFDEPMARGGSVASCPVCGRADCARHPVAAVPLHACARSLHAFQHDRSLTHPWEQILVHPEIDNVHPALVVHTS